MFILVGTWYHKIFLCYPKFEVENVITYIQNHNYVLVNQI